MAWIPHEKVVLGGIAFLHYLEEFCQSGDTEYCRFSCYLIYPYGKYDPEFIKTGLRWDRWVQYYKIPKHDILHYSQADSFAYRKGDMTDRIFSWDDVVTAVGENAAKFNIKIVGTFCYDEWDIFMPQKLVIAPTDKDYETLTGIYKKYKAGRSKLEHLNKWETLIGQMFPNLKRFTESKYEDNKQRYVR
jgi:hypothetical protein